MKTPTDRQAQYLKFITCYTATNGYAPTMREISDAFGVSIKGAYDQLEALKKKGYCSWEKNKSRTLKVIY